MKTKTKNQKWEEELTGCIPPMNPIMYRKLVKFISKEIARAREEMGKDLKMKEEKSEDNYYKPAKL